jgi:U3 small nucleolar RNA-associated protein 19
VQTSALQILLSLLKHLSTALCAQTPASPQMHVAHFRKLASALVLCPPSHRTPSTDTTPVKKRKTGSEAVVRELAPDVREAFAETWLTVHDDVRWFFLREAA